MSEAWNAGSLATRIERFEREIETGVESRATGLDARPLSQDQLEKRREELPALRSRLEEYQQKDAAHQQRLQETDLASCQEMEAYQEARGRKESAAARAAEAKDAFEEAHRRLQTSRQNQADSVSRFNTMKGQDSSGIIAGEEKIERLKEQFDTRRGEYREAKAAEAEAENELQVCRNDLLAELRKEQAPFVKEILEGVEQARVANQRLKELQEVFRQADLRNGYGSRKMDCSVLEKGRLNEWIQRAKDFFS